VQNERLATAAVRKAATELGLQTKRFRIADRPGDLEERVELGESRFQVREIDSGPSGLLSLREYGPEP
jgi:hypothetical protein